MTRFSPVDRRPFRAALVLLALAAMAAVWSGCGESLQENYEAPLSTSNCVEGWNAGRLIWAPSGQGAINPTSGIGLIGRQVWIGSNGGPVCEIRFDLGHGRVQVIQALQTVRDASEASKGLVWQNGDGSAYGLESYHTFLAESKTGWNACQADDGSVHLGSDCPPHDPSVKANNVISHDIGLELHGVRQAGGYVWWLGRLYQGLPPTRFGIDYDVSDGATHWQVAIVSQYAGQRGLCHAPVPYPGLCPGGMLAPGVLVTRIHPRPLLTVSMYAFHSGKRGFTVQPELPAALDADLIAHLQPVPLPRTQFPVASCITNWNRAGPTLLPDVQSEFDQAGRLVAYLTTGLPNAGCVVQLATPAGALIPVVYQMGPHTDGYYPQRDEFDRLLPGAARLVLGPNTGVDPQMRSATVLSRVPPATLSLRSLVDRFGGGLVKQAPGSGPAVTGVVALTVTRHADEIEGEWRAEVIGAAYARASGNETKLEITGTDGEAHDQLLTTLHPPEGDLADTQARSVIGAGLAQFGWIARSVTVLHPSGTAAVIVAEVPHPGRLPRDLFSQPWAVGESVLGRAYGPCDDCTGGHPRFSEYFLRLVDSRGRLILEGGTTVIPLSYLSATGQLYDR